MYHIYVFGDIFKYRLENELQLFCTCIIQKLHHLKGRPPPYVTYLSSSWGTPAPPYFDDVIYAQPLISTLYL